MKGEFMSRARVLLADDNLEILHHVTLLLQEEFDVVGAVPDGQSVLREFDKTKPDVVVLDISMGQLSGIDVALRLRDTGRQAKVVFLTVHDEQEYVWAAFDAGGSGYVRKLQLSDLPAAVRTVMTGRIFISPDLLQDRCQCS